MSAIRSAATKPVTGVINVVSFGFHEGKGAKANAVDGGRARADFLKAKRRDEIDAVEEWLPLLASRETAGWLITVVTKADLWWSQRDAVLEHYSNGEYAQALQEAKELRPVVMEYCSVFHRYFGEAPMDGNFEEADRTRARGHLMKQLLAATGKGAS